MSALIGSGCMITACHCQRSRWVSAKVAWPCATATGIGGTAATNGAGGPQVSHSVATTSGSGVVVTTQTKTVNGKTVVTQVRHTVPYRDY
jgi:hypothetical protein